MPDLLPLRSGGIVIEVDRRAERNLGLLFIFRVEFGQACGIDFDGQIKCLVAIVILAFGKVDTDGTGLKQVAIAIAVDGQFLRVDIPDMIARFVQHAG